VGWLDDVTHDAGSDPWRREATPETCPRPMTHERIPMRMASCGVPAFELHLIIFECAVVRALDATLSLAAIASRRWPDSRHTQAALIGLRALSSGGPVYECVIIVGANKRKRWVAPNELGDRQKRTFEPIA
jgi:hypothetical protein